MIDQLKGSKLSYAKQVILNVELIFGTKPQQQDLPIEDVFSVSHFLLNEHEMFLSFLWTAFDELIKWDMSHSLGKCTNFEIEEYECGTEVARHILQELVDEVVLDLYSSS
ncbi:hypothetical protein CQW23_24525 [Capsicum baccatum]|uniref:DUF4378 domain-containing protein n=1 Tax=Capsicum baccatum TaxID=33114 RepID=A0A2G2VV20_CAPBA|nr:hypothetical protein CQW23_24525 [Capsicum baccatum]